MEGMPGCMVPSWILDIYIYIIYVLVSEDSAVWVGRCANVLDRQSSVFVSLLASMIVNRLLASMGGCRVFPTLEPMIVSPGVKHSMGCTDSDLYPCEPGRPV